MIKDVNTKQADFIKICSHPTSAIIGKSNSGKSMFLKNLIITASSTKTNVEIFGVDDEINTFYSLLELEKMKNSFIFIDEVNTLFKLNNRKASHLNKLDTIFRMVNHNNNKIVLCGLPTDFNKWICGKIDCFCYKSLIIKDLINQTRAKELITEFEHPKNGHQVFDIPESKVLVYSERTGYFWVNSELIPHLDTKKDNINLFQFD